ncbi:hypothetical protein LXL04_031093 [Taraxacum kok-saghyz]
MIRDVSLYYKSSIHSTPISASFSLPLDLQFFHPSLYLSISISNLSVTVPIPLLFCGSDLPTSPVLLFLATDPPFLAVAERCSLLHDFCLPSVLHRNHRSDDSCDFTTEESSHVKKMKVPFFNGRFWKIPRKSERAASSTAVGRKKGFWIRRSEPEPKSCSRLEEKIGKCMVPVSNIGRLKVGFLNICSI